MLGYWIHVFFGFRVDFLSGSIGSRLNVRKAILRAWGSFVHLRRSGLYRFVAPSLKP